jgi:adenine deaminase
MAVTRQGLTREEAIRIYTTGGAWQDHMENVKGSIEAGKLADLCILDQDILTVDAPRIRDITTVATISGGKIVYGTGNLDQRARRKERSALGSREKQFKSRAGETTPEGLNTNSRSARTRTF